MPRPYIGPILRTRVSPDALARVDALAAGAGTTRAEVARAIIEERVTPPRTCAGCRHNLGDAKAWTCPPPALEWADDHEVTEDGPWPTNAPACPGKEP